MAEWKVGTSDEEIDQILAKLQKLPPAPTIANVEYLRERDLFLIHISDGRRIAIPREDIWAVHNATPEQAANFVSRPPHVDIWWPDVDEGLYIDGIIEGRYGNDAWMDHVHRRITVAA